MTIDELLAKLPSHIGRNRLINKETGEIVGYYSDDKPGNSMGWLYLHNDGKDWCAAYGVEGEFVCLNPDGPAPFNNAVCYASTPREALQGLYDWCIENGFIKLI